MHLAMSVLMKNSHQRVELAKRTLESDNTAKAMMKERKARMTPLKKRVQAFLEAKSESRTARAGLFPPERDVPSIVTLPTVQEDGSTYEQASEKEEEQPTKKIQAATKRSLTLINLPMIARTAPTKLPPYLPSSTYNPLP